MGRPGGRRLHQRQRRRGDHGPQRPPPRPLPGDARRHRRDGLRGRPRRAAVRRDRRVGTPRAGRDDRRRHGAAAVPAQRGDQARDLLAASVRRLGAPQPAQPEPLPRHGERAAPRSPGRRRARAADAARLHPRGDRVRHQADGARGQGAGRLHGRGHAAVHAVRPEPAALHLLQAEVRPGHEPPDRLDPGRDRDVPRHAARPPALAAGDDAGGGAPRPPDQPAGGGRGDGGVAQHADRNLRPDHAACALRGLGRPGRAARRPRRSLRRRGDGGGRRPRRDRDQRPPLRRAVGADPDAARGLHRASPPDPHGTAHEDQPGRGGGRCARRAPLRLLDRLRRQRRQPLPGLRDAARPHLRGRVRRGRAGPGNAPVPAGGGRRHPQGDVQDGHLRRLLLPRLADLRGARHLRRGDRALVPGHHVADRGDHLRGHRPRHHRSSHARLPGGGDAARRLVQVPPRRRLPRLRAEGLARPAQGGAGRRRRRGVPRVQRAGALAPAHRAARRPWLPVRPRPDRRLPRRADRRG